MSKEFQIRDGNLIASFDLENEDGDIDFCKLLKVSHGVAEEIGMFVDYVATNKIIKDQSKQISDLEAKLAESEMQANDWKQRFESSEERFKTFNSNSVTALNLKNEKIEKLKQQLAEKEKLINNYADDLEKVANENADLVFKLAEKEEIIDWQNEIVDGVKQEEELLAQKLKSLGVDCIEDLGKTYDQDKISFAVERLDKVKEYIKTNLMSFQKVPIIQEINNQIKQLKEME